jgi:hypothetical protein
MRGLVVAVDAEDAALVVEAIGPMGALEGLELLRSQAVERTARGRKEVGGGHLDSVSGRAIRLAAVGRRPSESSSIGLVGSGEF